VTVLQNSIVFQKQTSCRGDLLISSTPSKPWKKFPTTLAAPPIVQSSQHFFYRHW